MPRLIINADDFGFSTHTVDWTIRCFEAGVLSSATLMAGAAEFPRAAAFARANPRWSFGLHLVLSDETPLCRPEAIPSLVAPDGHLWPTRQFMLRSALGLIRSADLEREVRAQLLRLREAGVVVSHIDGHGHMHRMPLVLKALIRLKDELDLARLRPAQDLYYAPPRLPFGLWLNRAVNRPLRRHYAAPDHFLMTTGKVSSAQSAWFREMLPRLPGGCTEIGIHPGTDEPWRQLDTDDLLRHGRDAMLQAGFQLVSYHDISLLCDSAPLR